MRGEILYKILDFLEDASAGTADFFSAFLAAGYGASMGKIDREYRKVSSARHARELERGRRRRLQKYFSKLKAQGLIMENSDEHITLSPKGKKMLTILKKNKILDKDSYQKQAGNRVIIVSYDLPTPFNKERDILREILKRLGFTIVHKSVWVGKVKIPKEFLIAIEKLGILKYIEILEVTKRGSLNQLIK